MYVDIGRSLSTDYFLIADQLLPTATREPQAGRRYARVERLKNP
jgi:hypothetical protein